MFTATKYDAFISYSHESDGRLATALHRALERFAKPWYRRRESRVFHDDSGLNITEALAPRLREIISNSEHFLLLASPEAASSNWVEREVEGRLEDERPILIVLTGGEIVWDADVGKFDWERTTALPANLREHFAHEPLYVDLRWARERDDLSLRDPRFHDAVATLAATIRGVDKDELSSLAVKRHRRALRLAWSTIAVLLALLAGAIYQTLQTADFRAGSDREIAWIRIRNDNAGCGSGPNRGRQSPEARHPRLEQRRSCPRAARVRGGVRRGEGTRQGTSEGLALLAGHGECGGATGDRPPFAGPVREGTHASRPCVRHRDTSGRTEASLHELPVGASERSFQSGQARAGAREVQRSGARGEYRSRPGNGIGAGVPC
jgi:hypothetical protein